MKALFLALALSLMSLPAFAAIVASIPAMTCQDCAESITAELRANPAVEDVKVDVERKTATITVRDGADLSDAEIKKAVEAAGFVLAGVNRT